MSGYVALLAAICLIGGIVLQALRPGDTVAMVLIPTGTTVLLGCHAVKHREAGKAKRAVVDLEATATNLRAELLEQTRTK